MGLEQVVNQQLNKYPELKKRVKRAYQCTMYALSPKIKSEGDIQKVSPNDPNHEYFFGYYDKSPWDKTERYMLCLKAENTWSEVAPKTSAEILLIDTKSNNSIEVLATTHSWNVQQGCMLQWLGPDYSDKIIYNDFRDGQYCAVILNIKSKEEKILSIPVYSVSNDGTFALTLDFSRLHRLRPGYGYSNIPEKTVKQKIPKSPCIWKENLITGEIIPLLSYENFSDFQPRKEMQGAEHKVNHIMLNPDGTRFMVLHRWFNGQRKYTRLVTCNVDGSDMYNLSDDDMVSHCFWRNNTEIFAFEHKKMGGNGYYLMKDKTQEYKRYWKEIDSDGHPSFSPDGSKIVFDTYPDRARIASVQISDAKNRKSSDVEVTAKVFVPFKYDNDTRCDLHPRWDRSGNKICFDSVFEGHRGLYVVKLTEDYVQNNMKENNIEKPLISVVVPVYKVEKYLERCVKSIIGQTYKNIEIILVDDGSPDNSGTLCDELAEKYDNIKVHHKMNGGLSSARNTGLKIASGKYIAFVDSDDWINETIYNKCMNVIIKNNCDIVDFRTVYTDGKTIPKNKEKFNPIKVSGQEMIYDYLYRGQTEICPFSVCRKLYAKYLFNNITFPEGKLNEDIVTNFKILKNANSLVHISDIGYYYYQNENSITNGPLKKKDFDLLDASQELCNLSRSLENKKIHQLAKVKLARSYFSLLAKASVGGFSEDIENPSECIKILTNNLRKNYRLLMKAPISRNRKIMITAMAVNFNCIAFPAIIYKKIR